MFAKCKIFVRLVSSGVLVLFISSFLFSDLVRTKSVQAAEVSLPLVKTSEAFDSAFIRGLRFDSANPFNLEVIFDKGDQQKITNDDKKQMIRYFLTALTMPSNKMWVNLSPYEKDRILDDQLAVTEMGEVLLDQDYLLKQLSASLTHPDTALGKEYWQQNDSVQNENKIWIKPGEVSVYDSNNLVMIADAPLEIESETTDKQVLIPQIKAEVNNGKNFSGLRQLYHSVILAQYFKKKFKNTIYSFYIDSQKMKGVDLGDPQSKDKVFNMYVESFKSGAYDVVKKERNRYTKRLVKKHYFSGGIDLESSAYKQVDKGTLSSSIDNNGQILDTTSVTIKPKKAQPVAVSQQSAASSIEVVPANVDLSQYGIGHKDVSRNLEFDQYINAAVKAGHGKISQPSGAYLTVTGKHTGRSPVDRWLVDQPSNRDLVNWNKTHKGVSEKTWDILYDRITSYLSQREDVYVEDAVVGANIDSQLKVRTIAEYPHMAAFLKTLFRDASSEQMRALNFNEDFLLISAADCKIDDWEAIGLSSEAFIVTNLEKRIAIIGGTKYAGERKKTLFSVMNFLLPDMGILPMHCSANASLDQLNSAVFFGLSGTGKTTLSADEKRRLIGDDEQGWEKGNTIFNMEGGIYAKTKDLVKKAEPIIWNGIGPNAIVENVVEKAGLNELGFDFSDVSLSKNGRVAIDLSAVPNRVESGLGQNVNTVIFLTADASGTMPPIAKLSVSQAMYHYLSGYTSKLAGTEVGVNDPIPTFSAYFGEPFFARQPMVYADLLAQRIKENPEVSVFLVNTGWNGKGKRMSIKATRAMVTAALNGDLDNVNTFQHPIFKFEVPAVCPGVEDEILNPLNSWDSEEAYWKAANKLAAKFEDNIQRFPGLTEQVLAAGPEVVIGSDLNMVPLKKESSSGLNADKIYGGINLDKVFKGSQIEAVSSSTEMPAELRAKAVGVTFVLGVSKMQSLDVILN